jgi:Soluble lytic murein transglycosylase and related regulatory proteins (some contain LysM/invasin domains)
MLFADLFRRNLWVAGISLCLLSLQASAQQAPSKTDSELASHRFHYQKAKAALAQKNNAEFKRHMDKLGDYPLRQYLEFAQLRNRFAEMPLADIDKFLETYPDSFLASRLRSNLLQFLASREKWKEFNRYYSADDNTSLELHCHSLHARIRTGDKSAFTEVASLWDVGKSQPKPCDPVFTAWRSAGHQTEELVWSRFDKAMNQGETSFAKYLSNQLKTLKPKANLYLQVHSNPKLIAQRQRFQGQDLPTQHIIAYGVKKLARTAPSDALKHWQMYEAQQLFPEEVMQDAKLTIVKRLIRAGETAEAQVLLSYSHSLREEGVLEELLRETLAEGNWQNFAERLALLDDKARQHERWQYWAARAQDELKQPIAGFPISEEIYRELAQNRSFYGFMSADKLKQEYALVDESTPLEESFRQQVEQLPVVRRAHELWLTGNSTEARAELLHASRRLDDKQVAAIGQLARDWGWYSTGIQTMINGNLWNELTVRFPLAYREEVARIAQDTQLEQTLIYAIARQESAFDASARSPVGAMGLMQLMPQTAIYTAKKSGIRHANAQELLDVEHNMRLGGHYLNHLLQTFNGNRILAAAAYNAGPNRVNRWLSEQGKEKPVDVWIETIPFKETRQYVQNVLCFSVIYGYRLGQPTIFLSEAEAKQYL